MRYFALLAVMSLPVLPMVPAIASAQTAIMPPGGAPAAVPPGPPGPPAGHWHQWRRGEMIRIWRARFNAANTSHDGHLTLAQAKAADMIPIEVNFSAIDTKNRGYVTFNDILAWRMDRIAQRLEAKAVALRATD